MAWLFAGASYKTAHLEQALQSLEVLFLADPAGDLGSQCSCSAHHLPEPTQEVCVVIEEDTEHASSAMKILRHREQMSRATAENNIRRTRTKSQK